MALGLESKTETELESKHPGGFILDNSINPRTRASIYSQFIIALDNTNDELDAINDKSKVYELAEQYANTGFKIIEDYYDKKKGETLLWELFTELDKQYESIVKEEPI
jgi:hypothetical protein